MVGVEEIVILIKEFRQEGGVGVSVFINIIEFMVDMAILMDKNSYNNRVTKGQVGLSFGRNNGIIIYETQRMQCEGRNTPLGYYTDQSPVSIMASVLWHEYCL